eukprot:39170-Chlamydomonas_euryale.AAC.5
MHSSERAAVHAGAQLRQGAPTIRFDLCIRPSHMGCRMCSPISCRMSSCQAANTPEHGRCPDCVLLQGSTSKGIGALASAHPLRGLPARRMAVPAAAPHMLLHTTLTTSK